MKIRYVLFILCLSQFQALPSPPPRGQPPSISPKLVPGPPRSDLIKCPGARIRQGRGSSKKSMKECYILLPTVTDSLPAFITTDYAWIKGQGLKVSQNRNKNLLYVWLFVYFIQIRLYQVFPIHIFQSGTFRVTRFSSLSFRTVNSMQCALPIR